MTDTNPNAIRDPEVTFHIVNHMRPGMRVLAERKFDHGGVQVNEVIIDNADGTKKIVWCRGAWADVQVVQPRPGGTPSEITVTPNPLFHVNYPPGLEYEAREKVAAAFDDYWRLA